MVDYDKIAFASFWPGLQNVGTTSGTATITGTLNTSPDTTGGSSSSNLVGSVLLDLPNPKVITVLRVNLPDANGDLASRWFPLFGTTELTDRTAKWKLILYVGNYPYGRVIYFNFVSLSTSSISINQRLNIYGHLYTYPFKGSTWALQNKKLLSGLLVL